MRSRGERPQFDKKRDKGSQRVESDSPGAVDVKLGVTHSTYRGLGYPAGELLLSGASAIHTSTRGVWKAVAPPSPLARDWTDQQRRAAGRFFALSRDQRLLGEEADT